MKIAISGKGGVGKTSVAAGLATRLARGGRSVLAIDADPDANLAHVLGVPPEVEMVPIAAMSELIEERVGPEGGMYRLNPLVDDLPGALAVEVEGVRLMVMGGPPRGGSRCMCRENSLLRTLLEHILTGSEEAVVVDMEAGVEHLGRATARGVDALLVVVDRNPLTSETARRIQRLARDIGLDRLYLVLNRLRDAEDLDLVTRRTPGIPLLGQIPYVEEIEHGMRSPLQDGSFTAAIDEIIRPLCGVTGA